MKALILAAGYATRLYPLTENFPKPLIDVGTGSILDLLIKQLEQLATIDTVYLVSNHRYFEHFHVWLRQYRGALSVQLLDDGSTTNETRRGAIADIQLAVEHWHIDTDLLVCAADNIFRFSMSEFTAAWQQHPLGTWVCVRAVEDVSVRRRTGIATLGEQDRIVAFHEKPMDPPSQWSVPPLYRYAREAVPLIKEYLLNGGNPDAPGNFIAWLCVRSPVYAHRIRGDVLDIGTLESLESARRILQQSAQSRFGEESPISSLESSG